MIRFVEVGFLVILRFIFIVLCLLGGSNLVVSAPDDGGDGAALSAALARAELACNEGRFNYAQALLEQINVQDLSGAEQSRFYELNIRVSFAFERLEEMQAWIDQLYKADPGVSLDPKKFPPEAVLYLEDKRQETRVQERPSEKGPTVGKNWSPMNLFPFGMGHFHQDRWSGGLGFMLMELLVIGTSVSRRNFDLGLREKDYDIGFAVVSVNANELMSSYISFSMFAGVWGYEVLSLFGDEKRMDGESLRKYRRYVAWGPFGVGQVQNRQFLKATFFCVAEGIAMITAFSSDSISQRKAAAFSMVALTLVGAIDGRMNFKETEWRSGERTSMLHMSPLVLGGESNRNLGFGLQLSYAIP